jgi:hypothetical protein
MRESSELGSPKWYRREASYGGITGIHHRTSYSNLHRIEGKIAYFMEHQPSARVSRGRRAAFLHLSSRSLPVGKCLKSLPSTLELDNASRSRKTDIEGGSGLLYKCMSCCIKIPSSNHTHDNCLFLESGEISIGLRSWQPSLKPTSTQLDSNGLLKRLSSGFR